MDTINQNPQTPINTDTNQPVQPVQNSDYAKKGPLLSGRLKRTILFGCVGVIALIAVAVVGVNVFQQLNKPPELTPEPPRPTPTSPEPVVSTTPKFAYIKNGKNIWISNIEGQEKFSILELPLTSKSIINSLTWKDDENLGYTVCDPDTKVCEISTYNFKTKSVKPELTTSGATITKFAWSKDSKYLAYIEKRDGKINLRLKLGTVDKILNSVLDSADKDLDPSLSKSVVIFNKDQQYILYSTPFASTVLDRKGVATPGPATQALYIYQLNGAQIDEIPNVSYPFFLDENTVAYKAGAKLVYKDVGTTEESEITDFEGYNPALSPNGTQIAYWRDEVGFNNVVLGVYESASGVHRNILRGVIIPTWVSVDKIVGIKADSCIGERCLLYEFQTTSMVIVDVNNGEVISVDQGKTLSGVAFNAN